MTKNLLLFLTGILCAFAVSCSGPKYTSEEGKFRINFEKEPVIETQVVPTEIGNITIKMFKYEKSAEEIYLVTYSDYPEALIKMQDADMLLKGAREGVVGNFGTEVTNEKKGELDGFKTLEFGVETDYLNLAYKLVIVNNRLYQIGIMKKTEKITESEIDDFIGSFELI
jgi:hypothetical protein